MTDVNCLKDSRSCTFPAETDNKDQLTSYTTSKQTPTHKHEAVHFSKSKACSTASIMDPNLTTVRSVINPPAHHSWHHFSCLCGKRYAELRQILSNNEPVTQQQLQRGTAPHITALIHLFCRLIYVPDFSRLL